MLKPRALLGALTRNTPVEVGSPEDIKQIPSGSTSHKTLFLVIFVGMTLNLKKLAQFFHVPSLLSVAT